MATATARPRKERVENAAKRRRQLIEATTRSIVDVGLAKTTLATVSAESGLSQGVVVFYFKNKDQLFAEVLRHHYEIYQAHWQAALGGAGDDPVEQLAALMRADFDPAVCNAETLVVWHAFWGEASARPRYAEICKQFEKTRSEAMRGVCSQLLEAAGRSTADAEEVGAGIDSLTDGLWLRLYLSDGSLSPADGLAMTIKFVSTLFPDHADRLALSAPRKKRR